MLLELGARKNFLLFKIAPSTQAYDFAESIVKRIEKKYF